MTARRAMGRDCAVHVSHRHHVPIEIHHVWPKGSGGPDIPANRIPLCANAHGAIHDLLRQVVRANGLKNVPWPHRRLYGLAVVEYAARAWWAITERPEQLPADFTDPVSARLGRPHSQDDRNRRKQQWRDKRRANGGPA